MNLYIYSLGKTIYEGAAVSVTLPTKSGQISVLPEHVPLITALAKGDIVVRGAAAAGAATGSVSAERSFPISGGFAEVKKDKIIVLAD